MSVTVKLFIIKTDLCVERLKLISKDLYCFVFYSPNYNATHNRLLPCTIIDLRELRFAK